MTLKNVWKNLNQICKRMTHAFPMPPWRSTCSFNYIKGESDLVSSWMSQNKLSLCGEKNELMLIGHPKQLNRAKDFPDLEEEDEKLCRVKRTKYLGAIICESTNRVEQLKTVKRKIKK